MLPIATTLSHLQVKDKTQELVITGNEQREGREGWRGGTRERMEKILHNWEEVLKPI